MKFRFVRLVWVVIPLIFLGMIGIQESLANELYHVDSTNFNGTLSLNGIHPIFSNSDYVYGIAYLDNRLVIVDISNPYDSSFINSFFDDSTNIELFNETLRSSMVKFDTIDSSLPIILSQYSLINSNGKSINTMSGGENSILLINLHNNSLQSQEFIIKFFWERNIQNDTSSIFLRAFVSPLTNYFLGESSSRADVKGTYDFIIEVWDKDETSLITESKKYSIIISESKTDIDISKSFITIGNIHIVNSSTTMIILFNIILLTTIPILFIITYVIRRRNDPNISPLLLIIGIISFVIAAFIGIARMFGGGPL